MVFTTSSMIGYMCRTVTTNVVAALLAPTHTRRAFSRYVCAVVQSSVGGLRRTFRLFAEGGWYPGGVCPGRVGFRVCRGRVADRLRSPRGPLRMLLCFSLPGGSSRCRRPQTLSVVGFNLEFLGEHPKSSKNADGGGIMQRPGSDHNFDW